MKRLILFATALLAAASLRAAVPDMATIEMRMREQFSQGVPSVTEIEKLRASLNEKGEFAGLDYASEEFNAGDKLRAHNAKLLKLVKAYTAQTGKFAGDPALYADIRRALDYWITAGIDDQNWWHRIIGYPKDLMPVLVLLKPTLQKQDPALWERFVAYELHSWGIPKQRRQEGANGTDICKFTFATAVVTRDSVLLQQVMEKVNSLVRVVSGEREEGIQPDWSFSQHTGSGRQLYLGTYGREYIDGVMFFMEFTNKTAFALAPEKVEMIENLFLNGVAWMWYKDEIDANQCGRKIYDKVYTARSFVDLTARLERMQTPQHDAVKQMHAMMRGGAPLVGCRAYPRHDYLVARGEKFQTCIRMTSTRTVGNEAGNGQGFLNYHTGDGACYVKVSGGEYLPIFPDWNWRRIPGTTVVADTLPMPRPMWGAGGQGGDAYAGVAADGRLGVAGFIYAKDSLTAHKAWFCFPDYMVALGAGITTARKDAPVVTTVNQTALNGKLVQEGNRMWNNEIGYLLPAGAAHEVVEPAGKTAQLLITLSHGVAPHDATYEYALYPAVSAADFRKLKPQYEVLANTTDVQAVRDLKSGVVLAVFYRAGSLDLGKRARLTVAEPLVVIRRADGTLVTATPDGAVR